MIGARVRSVEPTRDGRYLLVQNYDNTIELVRIGSWKRRQLSSFGRLSTPWAQIVTGALFLPAWVGISSIFVMVNWESSPSPSFPTIYIIQEMGSGNHMLRTITGRLPTSGMGCCGRNR